VEWRYYLEDRLGHWPADAFALAEDYCERVEEAIDDETARDLVDVFRFEGLDRGRALIDDYVLRPGDRVYFDWAKAFMQMK
jgi:hypothetical protein